MPDALKGSVYSKQYTQLLATLARERGTTLTDSVLMSMAEDLATAVVQQFQPNFATIIHDVIGNTTVFFAVFTNVSFTKVY